MATTFVRHKVADYAAWRKVYDDFKPTGRTMGVTAEAVYRAADDPMDITVTHEFATVEAAQKYLTSAEVRGAMDKAGVVGAPTIWITNRS